MVHPKFEPLPCEGSDFSERLHPKLNKFKVLVIASFRLRSLEFPQTVPNLCQGQALPRGRINAETARIAGTTRCRFEGVLTYAKSSSSLVHRL